MKRILFLTLLTACLVGVQAAEQKPLEKQKWGHICRGSMPAEWYGSDRARGIADTVVAIQKDNGGWMKNDPMHRLTDKDYQRLIREKHHHSCLDNYATTQEMRFLARVWQATGNEAYRQSFLRGMNLILTAQKGCGGWSQYWPLSGDGSYQDYITFNDDLMTNVMRMLRDIYEAQGIFAGIADEQDRARCRRAFDRGLQCIIDCQIPDGKGRSIWCAQHDTVAPYYATEGRPHELPSYSGSESATLLSFLMSVEQPSKELKNCIEQAVAWLDQHKMADKAVEDYVNAQGEDDRRIVDQPGSALWPRFIQIGGKVAKPTYELFFRHLEARNKKRFVYYQSMRYSYMEVDNARRSYDPKKGYQPLYGVYKDSLQNLYYRFLYNYEDSPAVPDKNGVPTRTSLMPVNRYKYQFVGDWPWEVIYGEYKVWKQKQETRNEKGEWLEVDKSLAITNDKGKEYTQARLGTIKLNPIEYKVQIPEGKKAKRVYVFGFANGDTPVTMHSSLFPLPSSLSPLPSYLFPAKGYHPVYTEHTIELGDGVSGEVPLRFDGGQVCVIIRVLCE